MKMKKHNTHKWFITASFLLFTILMSNFPQKILPLTQESNREIKETPQFDIPRTSVISEWNTTWDVNGMSEAGVVICSDIDGNIIVGGEIYLPPMITDNDMIIVKYDPDGNQLWNRTWEKEGYDALHDIATDSQGNIYLTGLTPSGLDYRLVVIKYNRDGNQIWNRTYDGIDQTEGDSIVIDDEDHIILAGEFDNPLSEDILLLEYNETGDIQKERFIGANESDKNEVPNKMIRDFNGNIYIIGRNVTTVGFEDDFDCILYKLDENWNEIWNKSWGGEVGDERGEDIAFDSNGYIYALVENESMISTSYLLHKYNSQGELLWEKILEGDDTSYLNLDINSRNELYITGNELQEDNTYNYTLLKFDKDGNLKKKSEYGDYNDELAYDFMCFNDSIYVTGETNSFSEDENKTLFLSAYSEWYGYKPFFNEEFSWIEINVTGLPLTEISDADDEYEEVDLPFNFSFYGVEYDKMYVSSNGWISFTDINSINSYLNTIPSQGTENIDCIALLCSDLNLNEFDYGGGNVYYQEFGATPDRYIIIEYYEVYDWLTEELVGSFEVILYENGTIKFQYDKINYIYIFEYIIGLDHGDMTNYNNIEINLPITATAIRFEYDELKNVDYNLSIIENQQYMYQVEYVNHTAMEIIFGSDWETLFGFLPDMCVNQIMKVNISSIKENATHWEVDYSMWNWTYNTSCFDSTFDTLFKLSYLKNPNDYIAHDLVNLMPLFLPTYSAVYLRYNNLTINHYNYNDIKYGFTNYSGIGLYFDRPYVSFQYHEAIPFFDLFGYAYYNEEGLLSMIDLNVYDVNEGQMYDAFNLEIYKFPTSIDSKDNGGDGNGKEKKEQPQINGYDPFALYMTTLIFLSALVYYFSRKTKKF